MGKYFGTDGFRGKVNIDLTVDHAFRIGRYLGARFGKGGRVVIGKDTRKSCYMYECALSAGITASGADAYLMHVTSTPSVSYIAKVDDFNCGVMISASHNPYDDNGIKLLNSKGEKMDDGFIQELEAFLSDPARVLPYATGDQVGKVVDYAAGRNRYIGYLITLATHSYKDVKVGLDAANGSSWMIAKNVFETLGADVYVINDKPNGTNINLNCGSTHMDALRKLVADNGLDVGFAFDGDADRCLAVDERGRVVDGDGILYLYGRYMKDREKLFEDTIVTTIMSNFGLYKACEKAGIRCEKTDVGDRFVYERMRAGGYLLGGEQSGHIIFTKYANTGDGVLTAIKIMQAMLSQKLKLSQLVEGYVPYPQVLKNIRVADKEQTLSDPRVQEAVRAAGDRLGENGRILVRKSGTEPVLRVMAESASREVCEEVVNGVITRVDECGYLIEVKK